MNSLIVTNGIRFLFLLVMQVLVLRRVTFGWENIGYVHVLLYPLFILLLPIRTPKITSLLLAFAMGITIDIFYDSPGVHTSALVFMTYLRTLVLKFLEPHSGYNVEDSPTMVNFGLGWFMSYSSILLFLHIFFYFSVEAFSFVYIFEIMMNTFFSFIVTIALIFITQLIFRPKF